MQLPDVFLQVKVPAEAFATGGAGEGLLVIVRVHVERQVVHLMERFAADGTLELLLAAVGQLVVLVVSFVGGETPGHGCLFTINNSNNNKLSARVWELLLVTSLTNRVQISRTVQLLVVLVKMVRHLTASRGRAPLSSHERPPLNS